MNNQTCTAPLGHDFSSTGGMAGDVNISCMVVKTEMSLAYT